MSFASLFCPVNAVAADKEKFLQSIRNEPVQCRGAASPSLVIVRLSFH